MHRSPLEVLWYDGPAALLARPVTGAGDVHSGSELAAEAWARCVALGAVGWYAEAGAVLQQLTTIRATASRACSTLASHARQIGLHAEAAPLDQQALALAESPAERADATAGIVADAVAAGDADAAFAALPAAREAADADALAGADGRGARDADALAAADGRGARDAQQLVGPLPGWRSRTRLFWVMAELALLVGEARTAATEADEAVAIARAAGAPRHLTKSLLIRGVARNVAGHTDEAAMDLLTALERAQAGRLVPLVWPAASVAAQIVPARAAELRAVAAGAAAALVAGLGPRGAAFAARPDVLALGKPAGGAG